MTTCASLLLTTAALRSPVPMSPVSRFQVRKAVSVPRGSSFATFLYAVYRIQTTTEGNIRVYTFIKFVAQVFY